MIRADDRAQEGLPRDDRELEVARAAQVQRVAAQAVTAEARRRMTPAPTSAPTPVPMVNAVTTGQE